MKKFAFIGILLCAMVLQGCTTTFAGSVLVLNFRDVITYVGMAFAFAVIIALVSTPEKRRSAFWLWFILSLVITPLAGFIYLLIKLTKRNRPDN